MPRRREKKRGGEQCTEPCVQNTAEQSSYLVRSSNTMGRYLVASRDLKEGEVIITEDALVVGPAQDSVPVCLGCFSTTNEKCERCQWPICSSKCKGLFKRLGHSQEECLQLVKCNMNSNVLPQNQLFNVITPLRCLLLQDHYPDKWNILTTMEAHTDIRKRMPSIWDYNQITVVNRIRSDWKIQKYSEADIHKVCGILEVNAFSVGNELKNIRGLYPTSFLIAHSCVSNTSHTDDDRYRMTIFSSIPIQKDEMITLSYTLSLQGTKKRRAHLKQCKFFECSCSRCKDPTELGTYLSALKCSDCDDGHLLPLDALDDLSAWLCDNPHCPSATTFQASYVDSLLNRIHAEIDTLDHSDIKSLENTITQYKNILHKNHYIIIGLKYTLSQLYGKSVGYLIHQMSQEMLNRKKQICEEILSVFDILEPGLTTIRGLTMYELHAPIMILTVQRFQDNKISKVDLRRELKKVSLYLKECSRILKFETTHSEEGIVRGAAENALLQLKSWTPVVGKL